MEFSNWIIYLKERFPLPVYLLLAGGIAMSGTALGSADLLSPTLFCSFAGLMVFFALLRLMDELKDYEKDKIAHPERPLPRDLLPVNDVRKVIILTTLAMFVYGFILTMLFSPVGGLSYLILTTYLWLMYREFYIGKWLEQHQLLYAIFHQIVVIPVCTFPVLLATPIMMVFPETYYFSLLILGAFFSYEVSRKLDPQAHPVLRTYRSLYDIRGCFAMVLLSSFLAAFAAWNLGLKYFTWPFLLLLFISYALLNGRRHKLVEAVASLSLIIHIWAVVLVSIKELF